MTLVGANVPALMLVVPPTKATIPAGDTRTGIEIRSAAGEVECRTARNGDGTRVGAAVQAENARLNLNGAGIRERGGDVGAIGTPRAVVFLNVP